MSFIDTSFDYLDERDSMDFDEYLGTEYQDILVAGRKTLYRLEKYIPEKEFHRIRVVLTALVRDFNLPAVRYTSAIALTIYAMSIKDDIEMPEDIRNVVNIELALLLEHLMSDDDDDDDGNSERELFDRGLEKVSSRWDEYLRDPSKFISS